LRVSECVAKSTYSSKYNTLRKSIWQQNHKKKTQKPHLRCNRINFCFWSVAHTVFGLNGVELWWWQLSSQFYLTGRIQICMFFLPIWSCWPNAVGVVVVVVV